jgi:acylphosphatase
MALRAHVFVSGRVQGVFYRQSLWDMAKALGIAGWTRNLDDGRVEAVFEGGGSPVREAVKWYRKGPGGASVDDVDVDYDEKPEGLEGFAIMD